MGDLASCKTMLNSLGWNDTDSTALYDVQVINSIDEFRPLDDESVCTI